MSSPRKPASPLARVARRDRATEFAERVHTDVCGPFPVESLGKRRYYILFIDDATRYVRLYLLAKKNAAGATYDHFAAWAKTQFDKTVKTLQSDRGGEYTGKVFTARLEKDGTEYERNVHDTPEHNGVAERHNRILQERARALLRDGGLPNFLWERPSATPSGCATGRPPRLSLA